MTRRLLAAGLVAGVALMGVMWSGLALAAAALPEGFIYLRDCLDEMAATSNAGAGEVGLRNRQPLKAAMLAAGFRPYSKEWWHFELADEPFRQDGFDFEIVPHR